MKLLVLDNYESFSLVPYFKRKLSDVEVLKMGNLHTDQMWEIFKGVAPDYVFVDFCDQNAVALTNRVHELPKKPKIIIRLHGYEAFSNFPRNIRWDTVSSLLTVSPMYYDIVRTLLKDTKIDMHVVFNGLDMQKFQLQDVSQIDDNSVAYVSFLNRKKGIALLRTVMASWPERNFHIGGSYQEEPVRLYLEDRKLENVKYYGHVKTNEFLKGKRYIMSTSVSESFGMTLAEGMAMGLTPLVHGWPGADKIWPKACIWDTFDELKNI